MRLFDKMPGGRRRELGGAIVDIVHRIELEDPERGDFARASRELGHLNYFGRVKSLGLRRRGPRRVRMGRRIQIQTHDDDVATGGEAIEGLLKSTHGTSGAKFFERHDLNFFAVHILPQLGGVAMGLDPELHEPRGMEHAGFDGEIKGRAARDQGIGTPNVQVRVDVDAAQANRLFGAFSVMAGFRDPHEMRIAVIMAASYDD